MKLIGIDIGSSFVKGAVLDLDRLCLAHTARAPFPPAITGLPAGCFEVDPRLATDATRDTIVELLDAAPDCAGIVFCSQMGGLVLADRQGEPLTNYLSWRDQRTVLKAPSRGDCSYARMLKRVGTDRLNELGQDVKAGAMLSLLFWLHEQGRLSEGSIPLGLGEFIVSRLCGAAPATEPTSALGLLDLQSGDWHRRAFAAIGLSGLEWPRLAQISQNVGEFTYRGRSIPCYPAVGDHQAALAGSLLDAEELSINVSTGSQVSQLTDELRLGEYQTRPYFDGRFLNTITHLPAGRSLQVLIDLLTGLPQAEGHAIADPWKHAVALAERAAETDLTVDLSFFAGALGDRGAIGNITTENLTVGTLFRAAFRSMTENYRTCALRVSPPRDWTRLVFSGGLVQKIGLLREMIADRLESPHRIAPFEEDTLAGLLALALVVSGRSANLSEASRLLSSTNR